MSGGSGNQPVLRAEKRGKGRKTGPTGKSPSAGRRASSGGGSGAKPPKQRPSARKPARKQARGPFAWLGRVIAWFAWLIWAFVWRSALIVCLMVLAAVTYTAVQMPPVSSLVDGRVAGSVTLLDREGEVFAWRGEQFDVITSLDQVSPHLVNALVATEDRRFFRHFGVSPRGVASAVRINLSEGRGPLSGHGGSTLTQQTAKLLCTGRPFDPEIWEDEAAYETECRDASVWRKVTEAVYALAMEARYSKEDILTIYLNRAYLGASARGFEAASQRYFGVPARALNPAQSAMLAGLLVAPSRYAPTANLARSQERAATVIKLMYDQGYITEAQRNEAWTNPATLSETAQQPVGGAFADWVMLSGPSFLTRDTTEDVILRTTLDQKLQRAAEEAMEQVFREKVREGSEAQAAIIVMSADGAVRAMVGGRDPSISGGFNRAVQANRQTGSAFKPFVYAAALDMGYSPLATVVDEPITLQVPGSGPWEPKNYDRKFRGPVTFVEALKDSLNVPAVRISEEVGREAVRQVASDFGVESDLADGPALALGVSESTLLEMSGAYAGILNGGRSVTPYGLTELRLQGDSLPLMGQEGGFGERVISENAARELVWMMNAVIADGTGRRAQLPDARPAAAKTGTTQAARDAWFIGFTADYVAGVWMGYDDNTPLTGVTGGGLPADIWRETMRRVHADLPIRALPMTAPTPEEVDALGANAQGSGQTETGDRDPFLLNVLRDILGGQ